MRWLQAITQRAVESLANRSDAMPNVWFKSAYLQRRSPGDTHSPVKLGLKHRRPGFKKPIYEEISGDDLHRKTGLWSHLLQVIDRQNNRYRKLVTNAETGEILRSVDEPLDEHTGRGSAKKPNSQK